jgi:hypothetical protein
VDDFLDAAPVKRPVCIDSGNGSSRIGLTTQSALGKRRERSHFHSPTSVMSPTHRKNSSCASALVLMVCASTSACQGEVVGPPLEESRASGATTFIGTGSQSSSIGGTATSTRSNDGVSLGGSAGSGGTNLLSTGGNTLGATSGGVGQMSGGATAFASGGTTSNASGGTSSFATGGIASNATGGGAAASTSGGTSTLLICTLDQSNLDNCSLQ